MRKFIFFGVGLAGLAGLASCGPNPREAANQEYQQLLADCQSEYADQPPTMEKFQSCKNYAEGATIDAFIPTTDLTALAHADRLEIAREADAGEITVEEADEKMAELGAQLDQIYNARMIQNQQLEIERLNALSNILAATRPPPPVTIP